MHIIKTESQTNFHWKVFFRHLFKDHLFECSATLSYYFLFSIFPLAIFVSASFSTLKIQSEELEVLAGFIPGNILATLENYLAEISTDSSGTLIFTGIFLTLYSMGKVIQTMKRKFRLAYRAKPKKKTITDWIVSFVFVLLVMVSFYAMLILIVAGNYIFHWLISILPFLEDALPSFHLIRLLAVTAYLFFVLLGLYYILPGIKQKKSYVLPGTIFALISWVVMSYAFSIYLDRFSNIASLYGSLGAIIALLLWLFLINLILLLGARINSYFYLMRCEINHGQHNAVLH